MLQLIDKNSNENSKNNTKDLKKLTTIMGWIFNMSSDDRKKLFWLFCCFCHFSRFSKMYIQMYKASYSAIFLWISSDYKNALLKYFSALSKAIVLDFRFIIFLYIKKWLFFKHPTFRRCWRSQHSKHRSNFWHGGFYAPLHR